MYIYQLVNFLLQWDGKKNKNKSTDIEAKPQLLMSFYLFMCNVSLIITNSKNLYHEKSVEGMRYKTYHYGNRVKWIPLIHDLSGRDNITPSHADTHADMYTL